MKVAGNNLIVTLIKTAPLVHRDSSPGGILKRVKYCVRGLVFARTTSEWFGMLHAPEMALIVKNHPYLFHKLQRPYLTWTLNTQQRLEVLSHHYRFVLSQFSKNVLQDIYNPGGKPLVELEAEEIGTLQLCLECSGKQKEGDLIISLRNKTAGLMLASLSFSILKNETNRKEIFIGGLQGDQKASKEMVVSITRALYGLRPKALLVYALQQLAMDWGITHLRAVSDAQHVYRHFQKRLEVAASYDEFWIDCGGKLGSDRIFDLPVSFVARDISTIRANKRQMYRRRYAMLADIAAQIHHRMSGKNPVEFAMQQEPGRALAA